MNCPFTNRLWVCFFFSRCFLFWCVKNWIKFDPLFYIFWLQARKIEEHQRKYDRLRAERELRERQERVRKAREEHAKAAADSASSAPKFGAGAGAGAGGKGDFQIPPEFMDMFNDPEVRKCFEVS